MFLYRCFSIVTWTFYSFSHLSQFHRFGLDCHHTISPDILTTFILFNFIFWQCFFVDASRLLLEILTHFHISHNFIDFLCAFSCGFPKLYELYIGAHTSCNNQGNTESQRLNPWTSDTFRHLPTLSDTFRHILTNLRMKLS